VSDLTKVHRPLEADELDRWIAGLESGEHEQATGQLRSAHTDLETGKYGYCCLGLKCQIDGLDLDATASTSEDVDGYQALDYFYEHSGTTVYPSETPEALHGLSHKTRASLAMANDDKQFPHSFTDIAGVLRRFRDDLLAGRSLDWDSASNHWMVRPA